MTDNKNEYFKSQEPIFTNCINLTFKHKNIEDKYMIDRYDSLKFIVVSSLMLAYDIVIFALIFQTTNAFTTKGRNNIKMGYTPQVFILAMYISEHFYRGVNSQNHRLVFKNSLTFFCQSDDMLSSKCKVACPVVLCSPLSWAEQVREK